MASAPEKNRRRLPPATLLLIASAIIAAISIGVALWRSNGSASQENPAAKDWRVVGWAYAQAGDAQSSAAAYRRATALEPDNAQNWSSLGEALQTASSSVVPEAAEAFEKALTLDPSDPRARYFASVQKDLRGDHRGALDGWLALLQDTPVSAPWRSDLVRTIRQAAALHKMDVSTRLAAASAAPAAAAGIPGPTAEQLAAASSMSPGQQAAAARAMVERLAARLAASPQDADGWIHLMRSYMVLGESDRARQALASGLAAFRDDEAAQGRLRSAAVELGVRSPRMM